MVGVGAAHRSWTHPGLQARPAEPRRSVQFTTDDHTLDEHA
ncbi:hypothetical protein ACFS5L_34060 [Streptomyces phyllanthi]|nr:hypothetical protein [Streptomyces phyllanthi]